MKRYLKNKSFLTGAILAFIMLGMLVVSLFWLPYDPEEMYLAPKLSLPSISHLMGTDQFGRDVMSRIMKGIQVSFGILIEQRLKASITPLASGCDEVIIA